MRPPWMFLWNIVWQKYRTLWVLGVEIAFLSDSVTYEGAQNRGNISRSIITAERVKALLVDVGRWWRPVPSKRHHKESLKYTNTWLCLRGLTIVFPHVMDAYIALSSTWVFRDQRQHQCPRSWTPKSFPNLTSQFGMLAGRFGGKVVIYGACQQRMMRWWPLLLVRCLPKHGVLLFCEKCHVQFECCK